MPTASKRPRIAPPIPIPTRHRTRLPALIDGQGVVWIPAKIPRPAPPLLTREEAQTLLRIKKPGSVGARNSVDRLRRAGTLRATIVNRRINFRLADVLDCMDRCREG